jgi:macrophage erythroblast attacher
MLAFAFTETYHKFLSLPAVPLLHIALSSGLSALKTYSCSSADFAGLDDPGDDTSDDEDPNFQKSNSGELSCPVCSTDLHELARHVPCAHYSRSYIESDQMLLPNGRSCSLWRLQECGKRHGYDPRIVKDPYTGDVFPISALKKIFIS